MLSQIVERSVITPLVQGGAYLGLILALMSWLPPRRFRSTHKLEITVVGLCFASVQFRFGIFFLDTIPEYFLLLSLPSLFLLGPAVFLLTIRIMKLDHRLIYGYQFFMVTATSLLAVADVFYFHKTGYPLQTSLRHSGARNSPYFLTLVAVSCSTLAHYSAALAVFQYNRWRLNLKFGRRTYWLLIATVLAAALVFLGFLEDTPWLFLPGTLFFPGIVAGLIVTQVRFPGLIAYVERRVERARYEKTRLDGVDVDGVCAAIERLMSADHIYRSPELRLASLAKSVGVHKNQLSRVLNERYGLNFNAFINGRRIAEACSLLADTDMPVIQICYDCGFNSLSGFTAAFKKATGFSPRHFRQSQPRPVLK
jgi:AraC-like DNA-binding protein